MMGPKNENDALSNLDRVFLFIAVTTSRKISERFTGSSSFKRKIGKHFSPYQGVFRVESELRPRGGPPGRPPGGVMPPPSIRNASTYRFAVCHIYIYIHRKLNVRRIHKKLNVVRSTLLQLFFQGGLSGWIWVPSQIWEFSTSNWNLMKFCKLTVLVAKNSP